MTRYPPNGRKPPPPVRGGTSRRTVDCGVFALMVVAGLSVILLAAGAGAVALLS